MILTVLLQRRYYSGRARWVVCGLDDQIELAGLGAWIAVCSGDQHRLTVSSIRDAKFNETDKVLRLLDESSGAKDRL